MLLAPGCGGGSAGTSAGAQAAGVQQPRRQQPPPVAQPYGGTYQGGAATGDTQNGAAFARWVLEQDPRRQYITDAVVRGDQTLGVKVQPTVSKSDLQRLLVALTQGMARTFPGRALQVDAFYQSGDKLAEADYDPRTNQVDVRFTR